MAEKIALEQTPSEGVNYKSELHGYTGQIAGLGAAEITLVIPGEGTFYDC
jgi:hypothetical protein